jgi:TPR repeat protein
LELSGDQGNSNGQNNYGYSLPHRKGISVDLIEATRCLKLSADQGNSNGQSGESQNIFGRKGCAFARRVGPALSG